VPPVPRIRLSRPTGQPHGRDPRRSGGDGGRQRSNAAASYPRRPGKDDLQLLRGQQRCQRLVSLETLPVFYLYVLWIELWPTCCACAVPPSWYFCDNITVYPAFVIICNLFAYLNLSKPVIFNFVNTSSCFLVGIIYIIKVFVNLNFCIFFVFCLRYVNMARLKWRGFAFTTICSNLCHEILTGTWFFVFVADFQLCWFDLYFRPFYTESSKKDVIQISF